MKFFNTLAAALSLTGLAVKAQTPSAALASTISSLQATLPTCGSACLAPVAANYGCASGLGTEAIAATQCNCNNYGSIATGAASCLYNTCSAPQISRKSTRPTV